jgi:hypothetical protein
MLKLKEAATEFGIKGSANILAQTEPLWRLHSTVQDANGNLLPGIAINFHHFNYPNDDALRLKDTGGLLDFREWCEFWHLSGTLRPTRINRRLGSSL